MVGSYSMPGWLERVKNDYLLRRISRHDLEEIHDAAVKAAIKDQEAAGIDLVSDGELRRDNMIDHFTARLPGVADRPRRRRTSTTTSTTAWSAGGCRPGRSGSSRSSASSGASPTAAPRSRSPGPLSLVKRIRNEHYPSEEAFALDVARVMNVELRELVRAGATHIQIDEPYYSGFPEDLPWAVRALNALVEGVGARLSLHVCYGNRYGKPSWEGSYRYLFPAVLEARIDQLTLEFARRGEDDVRALQGVRPAVRARARRRRRQEPRRRDAGHRGRADPARPRAGARQGLAVNPDCGLIHLPRDVAFAKLSAMVEGTRLVRAELGA